MHGLGNPDNYMGDSSSVLMAEIVATAVLSETLSRISTFLVDKYYDKKSSERDHDMASRLEMAHIRIEAALETSEKLPPVTDVSLLRWRKKLKRASQECDAVLHRRKCAATEDTEVKVCSLPARIAHATKSLISSFGHKNDESVESSEVVVRRYEKFADGAGEFLRFVELRSVRRQILILDPLVGHLLAGRAFRYEISQGSRSYYFAGRPMCLGERGMEAGVLLRCQDHETPENNFVIGALMRVGESTDLVAIVAECLESLPPQLKPVADVAKQELSRVHTRGIYCYPFLASTDPVYWNVHLSETQRARPDPLCCRGGHRNQSCGRNSGTTKTKSPGEFPEPVIKLFVQRHFSPVSEQRRKKKTATSAAADDSLQVTAVFAPHASTEELPSGVKSFAVEVIDRNRDEQVVHQNVGFA